MIIQVHNSILPDQLQRLAQNLTMLDSREVKAHGFISNHQGLEHSIRASSFFTFFTDEFGRAMGVAGVFPTGDRIGGVWLLTTDVVKHSPIEFIKASRIWLARFSKDYDMLHNMADCRNLPHLKMLKLLDFKELGYRSVGPKAHTFVEFAKLL